MYLKVHHSLVDGVGLMRRLTRVVTDDPDDHDRVPVWAVGTGSGGQAARPPEPRASLGRRITDGVVLGAAFVRAAVGIAKQAVRPTNPDAATVFGAPKSVLNELVTPAPTGGHPELRAGTDQADREGRRHHGERRGPCDQLGGAAPISHRGGRLPEASLTAAVPVAMRDSDDPQQATRSA